MIHTPSSGSSHPDDLTPASLREVVGDAIRFWEGRRVGYNAVLAAVAGAWVVFTWPHFRPAFNWQSGLLLLVLAALANACYFAAYPIDIAIQRSRLRNSWKRHRWLLWYAGALFATVLACYWIADEIYPAVG
jgi:hypothetical protein